MLAKSHIRFIKSLRLKKYRDEHGCFVAEGSKLVLELYGSRFTIRTVYALPDWLSLHPPGSSVEVVTVNEAEMKRITALSAPGPVLSVVDIPVAGECLKDCVGDLTLVLDGISDPGNMGTIIRIADWFGIRQVICSTGSVDCYNPKVVQATMGSISRVEVCYTDLPAFFGSADQDLPVYGLTLDGAGLYTADLMNKGFLVVGNEAHGISAETAKHIGFRLSVPSFPPGGNYHPESLNAAVAAGIACAEFRRRGTDNE